MKKHWPQEFKRHVILNKDFRPSKQFQQRANIGVPIDLKRQTRILCTRSERHDSNRMALRGQLMCNYEGNSFVPADCRVEAVCGNKYSHEALVATKESRGKSCADLRGHLQDPEPLREVSSDH